MDGASIGLFFDSFDTSLPPTSEFLPIHQITHADKTAGAPSHAWRRLQLLDNMQKNNHVRTKLRMATPSSWEVRKTKERRISDQRARHGVCVAALPSLYRLSELNLPNPSQSSDLILFNSFSSSLRQTSTHVQPKFENLSPRLVYPSFLPFPLRPSLSHCVWCPLKLTPMGFWSCVLFSTSLYMIPATSFQSLRNSHCVDDTQSSPILLATLRNAMQLPWLLLLLCCHLAPLMDTSSVATRLQR